jgi:hypothetical protein
MCMHMPMTYQEVVVELGGVDGVENIERQHHCKEGCQLGEMGGRRGRAGAGAAGRGSQMRDRAGTRSRSQRQRVGQTGCLQEEWTGLGGASHGCEGAASS